MDVRKSLVRDFVKGELRVRWYKDKILLGDSHTPEEPLPPRVQMHSNYSLQVDNLQTQDTADYTCEIIRPEPWGPIKQTHSIEVLFSPTVPEDGFLEVRMGDYVDIGCETTGTPPPIVDWRKNGEPMALLEHRSRIRFRAEHRLLAGVYECIANNGVGDPARATITVVIQGKLCPCSQHQTVPTCILLVGLRAALAAKLEFAVPPARTAWYRDGRPVRTDDRVVQMVHDNVHHLIFRSVRKTDFGNYTFRAENKLGMADLMFKLTGVPNAASFKVDPNLNKATATSFTLIWEVDSYSTIIEYNLWLRPYYGRLVTPEPDAFTTEPPANHWIKIIVPGDSSDGPIHSAIYTVRGLTPSTVYEAIVTSRNRFGWSKPSSILHFATEPGAGRTRPSTADYSEITPILVETEPEPYNISQAQVFERLNELSNGARETTSLAAILIYDPDAFAGTIE
ncbi:hypothetical protein HW555_012283 [Spodoptera exigua]|uniref:Uncharacterized protein n=1 Tax=Spodoptera exigua TaxID=7107 RepID=A0A835G6X4_SPOEX|nr:hypothetical protein HW555_012283 [Spodoptera exigua]